MAGTGGWGFGKRRGTNASNSASKIRVGYRGGKKNALHNLKHLMWNHTLVVIALLSYTANKEALNFTIKRATFNP